MQMDATKYARKCEQCQKYDPMIHQPTGRLNPIISPWPFAQWGARYRRSIPLGYRKPKVCSSSCGLFHQMGGDRGVGKHPRCGCQEACMEKHSDKVRGTRVPSVR